MRLADIAHIATKLRSTLRIAARLVMARTFGRYEITVWDGHMSYAVYEWRGQRWAIPTSSLASD